MLCISLIYVKQMDYLICKAGGFSVIAQLCTNKGFKHVPQHHHSYHNVFDDVFLKTHLRVTLFFFIWNRANLSQYIYNHRWQLDVKSCRTHAPQVYSLFKLNKENRFEGCGGACALGGAPSLFQDKDMAVAVCSIQSSTMDAAVHVKWNGWSDEGLAMNDSISSRYLWSYLPLTDFKRGKKKGLLEKKKIFG